MSEFSFTDVWEHLSFHSSSKQAHTSTVMGEGGSTICGIVKSEPLDPDFSDPSISILSANKTGAGARTDPYPDVGVRQISPSHPTNPPVVKHTLLKYYHINHKGESSKLWTNTDIYHQNIDQHVIKFKRENIDDRRSFRWQVIMLWFTESISFVFWGIR